MIMLIMYYTTPFSNCTSVQVGVDVPDSSICIIDRAANFGLSQLHQIRGRIGRGEKPPLETLDECFCVLLYDDQPNMESSSPINSAIGSVGSIDRDSSNRDSSSKEQAGALFCFLVD